MSRMLGMIRYNPTAATIINILLDMAANEKGDADGAYCHPESMSPTMPYVYPIVKKQKTE